MLLCEMIEKMVFEGKFDNRKIEAEIEDFLFRHGYELVDFQLKGNADRAILEVYVDRIGGITVKDLSEINGRLSLYLEASDFFPGTFQLVISSPGLDRIIKKEADFIRFTGRKVRLKPAKDSERVKKCGEVTLLGFENGEVIVEMNDKSTERFSLSELDKVRLVPDIDFNNDGKNGKK
ncbi:ribosome maturation factor RimP [bacterium]|nr:ribosome maturation factor RimP [bacterium]MBU1025660.1 ribosome maturation factor RimP [bacterium]